MGRITRITCVQLPADLRGKTVAAKKADNMRHIRRLLAEAGRRKSDIVLLGEYSNLWHRSVSPKRKDYIPDPIPGGYTRAVAALARRHRMNVALPLYGTCGGVDGSYVVLFDRKGKTAGVYLKSHPTLPEQELGMAAGDELPVFRLDCARVGIMTCMDIEYPEVAQALMLKGAEILLFPHVQAGWGEPDWEIRYRARAVDTGLFLASACYGYGEGEWLPGKMLGRSGVVGRDGLILSDCGRTPGLITTVVDLDEQRVTPFFFNEKHPRTAAVMASRRPELYGVLLDTGLRDETRARLNRKKGQ